MKAVQAPGETRAAVVRAVVTNQDGSHANITIDAVGISVNGPAPADVWDVAELIQDTIQKQART